KALRFSFRLWRARKQRHTAREICCGRHGRLCFGPARRRRRRGVKPDKQRKTTPTEEARVGVVGKASSYAKLPFPFTKQPLRKRTVHFAVPDCSNKCAGEFKLECKAVFA